MKIWMDLLTTDYGLMSAGVVLFMLGMAVYYTRMFIKKSKDS